MHRRRQKARKATPEYDDRLESLQWLHVLERLHRTRFQKSGLEFDSQIVTGLRVVGCPASSVRRMDLFARNVELLFHPRDSQ